jgi:uncharacterized membrane protein YgaE (UPF0421/DUF939 family)
VATRAAALATVPAARALLGAGRPLLAHSARTAVAAIASLLVARWCGLPEAYWAPMATLPITQSSLEETLGDAWHRFLGTALGALMGAVAASLSTQHGLAFAACVFLLGLLRPLTRHNLTGYRTGALTLAIVLLVPRTGPLWLVAWHRFAEVSIGIGVALLLTVVWPEREVPPLGNS